MALVSPVPLLAMFTGGSSISNSPAFNYVVFLPTEAIELINKVLAAENAPGNWIKRSDKLVTSRAIAGSKDVLLATAVCRQLVHCAVHHYVTFLTIMGVPKIQRIPSESTELFRI
jgi:hypothetical protein